MARPKRKRKKRLPKNYDAQNPGPMPDPERWLPKFERSYFKKGKQYMDTPLDGSLFSLACFCGLRVCDPGCVHAHVSLLLLCDLQPPRNAIVARTSSLQVLKEPCPVLMRRRRLTCRLARHVPALLLPLRTCLPRPRRRDARASGRLVVIKRMRHSSNSTRNEC